MRIPASYATAVCASGTPPGATRSWMQCGRERVEDTAHGTPVGMRCRLRHGEYAIEGTVPAASTGEFTAEDAEAREGWHMNAGVPHTASHIQTEARYTSLGAGGNAGATCGAYPVYPGIQALKRRALYIRVYRRRNGRALRLRRLMQARFVRRVATPSRS